MPDSENGTGNGKTHEESVAFIRAAIVALAGKTLREINSIHPDGDVSHYADVVLKLAQAEQLVSESEKNAANQSIINGVQGRIVAEVVDPLAKAMQEAIEEAERRQ